MYGYEIVPEAVVDARRNAERNGIRNATFIQSDLNKLINDFHQDFPQPDIVITGIVANLTSVLKFQFQVVRTPFHRTCVFLRSYEY